MYANLLFKKLKCLIPKMEAKENVFQVKRCLGNLNTLSENADPVHNELLLLFTEDEMFK